LERLKSAIYPEILFCKIHTGEKVKTKGRGEREFSCCRRRRGDGFCFVGEKNGVQTWGKERIRDRKKTAIDPSDFTEKTSIEQLGEEGASLPLI